MFIVVQNSLTNYIQRYWNILYLNSLKTSASRVKADTEKDLDSIGSTFEFTQQTLHFTLYTCRIINKHGKLIIHWLFAGSRDLIDYFFFNIS